MALLEIRNLSVSYGHIQALADVDVSVEAGGITAVVGANGAGKSTCLKAVSGVVPVRSGSVLFEGRPIEKLSPRARMELGIAHVMEGRRIFSDQSVEDNLLLGGYARLRRTRSTAAMAADRERLYERFPILGQRRNQIALTLSGGEQQMLAIAMALMSHPRLLLLDEPSLGLAPKIVQQLGELLVSLRAEGLSILLVEQMASMALALADYGYSLERGRLSASGPAAQLLKDLSLSDVYFGREAG